MSLTPVPIKDNIVDQQGNLSLAWLMFFNGLYEGDAGETWTPTFTSLTEVGGSATITGAYYQISNSLLYFAVTVTPATNTSSTAGTTYINNFPLTMNEDGVCIAAYSGGGTSAGWIDSTNNRIYTPGWSTVAAPVTIAGLIVAR